MNGKMKMRVVNPPKCSSYILITIRIRFTIFFGRYFLIVYGKSYILNLRIVMAKRLIPEHVFFEINRFMKKHACR